MHSVLGSTTQRQVAFVGPLGVGKTTAVRAISDVPVVSTEVIRSSVAVGPKRAAEKPTTTVGIDYGEWVTPDGTRVGVLGTPGQLRFASARSSVVARRASIVLWGFGDRPETVEEMAEWLTRIGDETVWARTIVALTRREAREDEAMPNLGDFRARLAPFRPDMPLLEADPRDRDQVVRVVLTALDLNDDAKESA
ncbi:hypothetical protein BJY21_004160 [Kineosphaera limosa]|uniref:ATP/GTP-binding protein n=1 Tax=Kineosphaera limosa NBRC 100340 TaxID=1184609 RepID=K6WMU5_9MICO|nr:hypothetical protein [Kineosphaera limosa]NYE02976.1 hypothetical protein [Kineosphaera limosa]GAB95131.1 hypothetical protein KILIM_016_00710 [Kineosphaera limosa NBRC 100340]